MKKKIVLVALALAALFVVLVNRQERRSRTEADLWVAANEAAAEKPLVDNEAPAAV